jgi:uncharacterized membrane protein YdjX (TVP38/TMEM64 family)
MKHHVHLGAFLFVLIEIFMTPLWFPFPLFKLGAGFAMKQTLDSTAAAVMYGAFMVFTGSMIGSFISFLISRYMIASFVRDMTKEKKVVKALHKAINSYGLKLLIPIRMTPIIPFNFLNYLLGVSEVTTKHFLIANLGLLPGIFIEVFIGTTLSSLKEALSESDETTTMDTISIAVAVSCSVIGAIGMICVARRIRMIMKLDEQTEQTTQE